MKTLTPKQEATLALMIAKGGSNDYEIQCLKDALRDAVDRLEAAELDAFEAGLQTILESN